MAAVVVFPGRSGSREGAAEIFFDRREWSRLIDLYGRMVAAGEWCDYGLERGRGRVAFLVFRGNRSLPAFRIVKAADAEGGAHGGRPFYFLTGPDGRILRRAASLTALLAAFERRLIRLWQRERMPG